MTLASNIQKDVNNGKIPNLTPNAMIVLEKRYLLQNERGEIIETPAQLFRRVAKAIAENETQYGKDPSEYEKVFYEMMTKLEFLPNSPTLMNAGTKINQLSACFVLPVEDDMDSIFQAIKNAAIIHKSGGGTGFSFSRLRPTNDKVKTTGGVASGPISFMTVFNSATEIIKQGGCLSAESYIRTKEGVVKIGKLLDCPPMGKNFSKELVFDGEAYNNVLISVDNGLAEVLKLKTEIGIEIDVTLNHQIACINKNGRKEWRSAHEIKEGDWVVLVLGGHTGKDILLPRLEEQHFNASPIEIPQKMTPELGEILGLYMADGCLSTGGRIIISVDNKDSDLVQRIKHLMKACFKLKLGRIEDNETWSDLVFYSHDLCRFFEKMKWKKESSTKAFIPNDIFCSSSRVAKAFVRGLFEGDGNVHPDGYPRYFSTSKKLIEQLQQLLLGLNIVSRYNKQEKGTNSYGKKPIYTLTVISDRNIKIFKKEIGFLSKRKQELFNTRYHEKAFEYNDIIPNQEKRLKNLYTYVGKGSGKGRGNRGANRRFYRAIHHYISENPDSRRNLTRKRFEKLKEDFDIIKKDEHFAKIADSKYYFTQIKEKHWTQAYTMDIEVPSSGKFVANGLLVHNRRRGANMGVLKVDHPDILNFIECKSELDNLNNFNISVGITERFMEAVLSNSDYSLVNPRNGEEVEKINSKVVFDKIIKMAHRSGEPGIIFLDRINAENPTPHIAEIEATNPCGEQPLLPYESCNLGSINLSKMVKTGSNIPSSFTIDFEKLEKITQLAVRFLDNVIDVSTFPLPEIEEMTKSNRKIGLGVMGFADLLIKLGIPYNSSEGTALASKIMRFIHTVSIQASQDLARERGSFPNFEGSKLANKYPMMRNATLTTLAPTGTISIIAGCSSGIEPLFMLTYERRVLDNDILVEGYPFFVRTMQDMKIYSQTLMEKVSKTGSIADIEEIPENIKEIFVTSHDISPEAHVKMQAAFQISGVDNAVSKTINFPNEAEESDIQEAYLLAYKLGCKGLTVYRSGSRTYDVLSIKGTNKEEQVVEESTQAKTPRYRPNITQGITERVRVGCGTNLFITINEDEEGLTELFLSLGKSGGCVASHIEAMGRLISLTLRSRIDPDEIILQLKAIRCPSPTFGPEGPILSCADAVAKSVERFLKQYSQNGNSKESISASKSTVHEKFESETLHLTHTTSGLRPECPECGNIVEHSEGCMLCRVCGYSKCG